MDNNALTKDVESWWDSNPFTYNGKIGVGKIAETDESLTLEYFDKAEARFRKHSGGSMQEKDKPVFSKFVDYGSLKGRRVLDIAVGTGFSAVAYAKAGAEVYGIDLTDYAILQTQKNFELRGLKGTILKMDAQKLDFPDNYFDFVSAHGCLMHMPDTQGAVKEIFRVLKPEGKVHAWMYHRGWYFWFSIIFLRGILCGQLFKNNFKVLKLTSKYTDGLPEGGNPHTKMFSRRGFRRLFKNAGFSNVHVVGNYNPNEWEYAWPMVSFPIGKFLPASIRRFLSERAGFAFSATISATKK
jgi:ubiquinone/menaquinone biosynthesis C-methylase UbiE